MKQRGEKMFLAVIAIIGAVAVLMQFYTIIANRMVSLAETIIRYFSFFTIQSNILVTVCATLLLLNPYSSWGKFFSRASTRSALTVYIIIVGLVYNLVLRQLYHLVGLQRFADELLHVAIPGLFVLYWIIYVPKPELKWNILPWLIYPVIYAVYVLIRGAFVNYYPYPFLNAVELGYPRVMLNIAVLVAAFVGFSFLLVVCAKLLARKNIS